MFKRYLFTALLIGCTIATPLLAQEQIDEELDESALEEIRQMSLEDILKLEISVASQIPVSITEAPGIVTLITRDDIRNSGARDLIDVLTLLAPGFNFQQSQYGPLGINVRGIWAFEGKTLLLIDGVEANDEAFAGIIFGNHYLLDNIDRIEIIRGPGSVIYGEHAALGVINIITRGYKTYQGGYAGLQISQMFRSYSHRNASFGFADKYKELGYSLTGYAGKGRLSDRNLVYYDGTSSCELIQQDPASLNMNLNFKGLDFRGIYDRYSSWEGINITSESFMTQLKYDLKLSDNFTLTARVNNKVQYPWKIKAYGTVIMDDGLYVDTTYSNQKRIDRHKFTLSFMWDIHPGLNLASGAEYTYTKGSIFNRFPGYYEIPFGSHQESVLMRALAFYSQLMFQNAWFNITLGGRYEYSRDFGGFFVPRIALTRKFEHLHLKAMVSQSYRLPGGAYFDLQLKPEKAVNYEFEAGYTFSKNHSFTLDYYDILFRDVIAAARDNQYGLSIQYVNQDRIGTRGIEAEYKLIRPIFSLGINASYFQIYNNSLEAFRVPGYDNKLLGNPSYRLNGFAGFNLNRQVSIHPSISYFGQRYGYISGEVTGFDFEHHQVIVKSKLKRFDPTAVVNLNIVTKDLFVDKLELDLGVMNLFNTDYEYIQPFAGFSAPIPGPSSALVLKAYYEFGF